jgi:hypothetical protein
MTTQVVLDTITDLWRGCFVVAALAFVAWCGWALIHGAEKLERARRTNSTMQRRLDKWDGTR